MIVNCRVYEDGCRCPGEYTPETAARASRRDGSFAWIGLHEPTEDEFESVRKEFGLHELAVEDAIKAHQRAKLEVYGESVFVVLKPAFYFEDTQELELGEVMLFLGDGFVVSVRHGAIRQLGEVRHRL